MLSIRKYFTLQNFALFLIVVFCIRYIPIDSRAGISYFKIAISLLCPLFFFVGPQISKAFIYSLTYLVIVFSSAILHPESLRWSTLIFLLSYFLMYITFYNIVCYKNVLNIDSFLHFVKSFIMAYFILLVIQQVAIIVGIREMPIINLTQFLDRGLGANSLSGEPSVSARILAVLFLCLIRMLESKLGHSVSFKEIYREAKWPTIVFLWSMLTMGSGTAMIALGVLLLYFVKPKHLGFAFIIVFLLIVVIPQIEFEPLQRAVKTFSAFLTLDSEAVRQADNSAAARVVPLVNTLTSLDLTDWNTWFGNGVDTNYADGKFSDTMMIGGIRDYGLLSFLVIQVLFFSCAIKKFFSIETLLWIGLFNMTLGNVPYGWGVFMILTVTKHITRKKIILASNITNNIYNNKEFL